MHRFRLQLGELMLLVALAAILLHLSMLVWAAEHARPASYPLIDLLLFLAWLAAWITWALRDTNRAAPEAKDGRWFGPLLLAVSSGLYVGNCYLCLRSLEPWTGSTDPLSYFEELVFLSGLWAVISFSLLLQPAIRGRLILWAVAQLLPFMACFYALFMIGEIAASI